MPRVNSKTKNKAGDPYPCVRCPETIKAGEKYYEWSFRYGGTKRQHQIHGSPMQSQLTQSKMSGAYAAIESAEDEIGKSDEPSDIAAALNSCAEEVDSVKEEYQEGLNALPDGLRDAGGPGGETQEKIDALDEFVSSLQNAAGEIEGEEFHQEEGEDAETRDDWIEGIRQQATDALGEFSL